MALLMTHKLSVTIAGIAVCHGLDIAFEAGQCWGILGKNGSGKTTLLQTLAGLRSSAAGEILINASPLSRITRKYIARSIGILFQDYDDMFPSTVLETVLIGRHPYLDTWQWESAQDVQRARIALQQVGMSGMESRIVTTLSGGERQRVEIATLLTQDPLVYLLDEPTNHLDLNHQIGIIQTLREHVTVHRQTLVMVLHDINIAARFCDHLLLLFGNGDYRYGTKDEMMTEELLARLYDHPIRHIRDKDIDAFLPA